MEDEGIEKLSRRLGKIGALLDMWKDAEREDCKD